MCRRQGVSRVRIGGDRRRLGRVTRAKVASGWAAGGGRLGLSWPGHCVQTAGRAAPGRPTRPTSCRRRLERTAQRRSSSREHAASFALWLERGLGMPSRSCRDCRWGWATFHGVDLSWRTASFAPCLCCAASPPHDASQEPAPERGGPTREVGIFSLFRRAASKAGTSSSPPRQEPARCAAAPRPQTARVGNTDTRHDPRHTPAPDGVGHDRGMQAGCMRVAGGWSSLMRDTSQCRLHGPTHVHM